MNHKRKVQTLGGCRVDGVPVKHGRALELVALLSLSKGSAPRDWVLSTLFEGDPALSSLPTLALRARKMGLDVRYDRDRSFYHLEGDVCCDVTDVLRLLDEGEVGEAIALYHGPFLGKSYSPFASHTRDHVEQRIVRSVIDSGDLRLIEEADRVIKHPELCEELVRRGGDKVSASLSRSWLAGLQAVG